MNDRNEKVDLNRLGWAFFDNLEFDGSCEYGSIGIDCKRPFGNSNVEGDICELIGMEPEGDNGEDKCWSSAQLSYAGQLYQEKLVPYLKKEWERKPIL